MHTGDAGRRGGSDRSSSTRMWLTMALFPIIAAVPSGSPVFLKIDVYIGLAGLSGVMREPPYEKYVICSKTGKCIRLTIYEDVPADAGGCAECGISSCMCSGIVASKHCYESMLFAVREKCTYDSKQMTQTSQSVKRFVQNMEHHLACVPDERGFLSMQQYFGCPAHCASSEHLVEVFLVAVEDVSRDLATVDVVQHVLASGIGMDGPQGPHRQRVDVGPCLRCFRCTLKSLEASFNWNCK